MFRLLCAAALLNAATPAFAQMTAAPASAGFKREAGTPSSQLPKALREIGFDQRLDERLPLDTPLRDEAGGAVNLGDYFGKRPVVLVFAYYDCPMLCTLAINGLSSALNVLSLNPGTDFEIVTISIDPRDSAEEAARKKDKYVKRYGRLGSAAGWHFLTGPESAIRKVADTVGFHYAYDPQTDQFAHATALLVLTPAGRVSRYLYGFEYKPRDVRLALVEASANKIGTPTDALLLLCYHYDPVTGKYSRGAMTFVRAGGIATVAVLGGFIFIMIRRERAPR